MLATTRGLMESGLTGEFMPDEALDGAGAILAIRMLRKSLNKF